MHFLIRIIPQVWKGLLAIVAALIGKIAGSRLSDQKEKKRREELLEEERLRHERLTRSPNRNPWSE